MAEKLRELVHQLKQSGNTDPKLLQWLEASLGDPEKMEAIAALLEELQETDSEGGLNVAEFYTEGDGEKFQLRWPIGPGVPVPVPVPDLDRETQFFVLFSEWQRREAEGMLALSNGDPRLAQEIFQECRDRAEQLDIAELRARSYEGLMHVAQRLGDGKAEAKWSGEAQRARKSA